MPLHLIAWLLRPCDQPGVARSPVACWMRASGVQRRGSSGDRPCSTATATACTRLGGCSGRVINPASPDRRIAGRERDAGEWRVTCSDAARRGTGPCLTATATACTRLGGCFGPVINAASPDRRIAGRERDAGEWRVTCSDAARRGTGPCLTATATACTRLGGCFGPVINAAPPDRPVACGMRASGLQRRGSSGGPAPA